MSLFIQIVELKGCGRVKAKIGKKVMGSNLTIKTLNVFSKTNSGV
jgi:hypothetical protein